VALATDASPPGDSGFDASHASFRQLLASKLFIPPPASTLVDRPRLVDRLAGGLHRPLTLIAAPPGWGKTTLLSAWAAAAHARRVAWVSLDTADNDPTRFWSYVILALQQVQLGVGDTALAALKSHQPAPVEAVLTPLLNELATLETEAALVLDDYHAIETTTVHQGLTFSLITSRQDCTCSSRPAPIRRCHWRAGGPAAPCSRCARMTCASTTQKRNGS